MKIKLVYLVGLCISALLSACAPERKLELSNQLLNELSSARTGISFRNDLKPTEALNIITYLYYYNGGGIAAGDVNGDGLIDLYFTANQGADALYINEGDLRFRENTKEAGLSIAADWSSGASFTDIDADGDLDLYVNKVCGVAGLSGRNELYINDGKGGFSESAKEYGLDFSGLSTQTAFIDVDGDGDLDAYQLNHSIHDTERRIDTSMRKTVNLLAGDRLYLQNDEGFFEDASAGSGIYQSRLGYGLGIIAADFNGDLFPDFYVSNDFSENDYLYLNQGEGRFKESVKDAFPFTSKFSMGSVAADINSDGLLDLFTLDMRPASDSIRKSSAGDSDPRQFSRQRRLGFVDQHARNTLHIAGTEQAISYGVHSSDWSWAPVIADFNLDGKQDIFIANGIWQRPNDLDYLKFSSGAAIQRKASNLELASLMPPGIVANHLYLGANELPLENVARSCGLHEEGSTTAALAIDLDNDGDPDLVTNNVNAPARIFENSSSQPGDSTTQVLTAHLEGTPSNPYSIGAKIKVETSRGWKRLISIQPVTGFQSSLVSKQINIAIPKAEGPATIQVTWSNGVTEVIEDAAGTIKIAPPEEAEQETIVQRNFTTERPIREPSSTLPFEEDPLLPIFFVPKKEGISDHDAFFSKIVGVELVGNTLLIGRERVQVTSTYLDGDTLYVASLWSPIEKMWWDGKRNKFKRHPLSPTGLWSNICELSDGTLLFENVGYNNLLVEHPGQQLELHLADFDQNGELDPITVRLENGIRRTLFGLDDIAEQMPTMRKFFTSYLPFSSSTFDEMFPKELGAGGVVFRAETLSSMTYDKKTGISNTIRNSRCGNKTRGQLFVHPLLQGGED